MTSFNHYSFGSVVNWMHQVIGGIAPLEPGYKAISIAPIPGVSTDWNLTDAGFHLRVRIPPNTKAEITVPGTDKTKIVGSGVYEFHQLT
ncbi:hypothetical protein HYE67_007881 [Fusarium culmorum]|uniref:Alpha-L-rhamnosidase C-terminal domain-containing protein n=1 Tax=Fusarium culmorum TaxID=5516 RepID=A0A7S8HYM8_FUSCU|nr:hypothetical protein HYE67_007881 [Fusarium culmorum]